MQTGGMLLADIVWLFESVNFLNLMTAEAKCNFDFEIQAVGMLLANLTYFFHNQHIHLISADFCNLLTAGERCN